MSPITPLSSYNLVISSYFHLIILSFVNLIACKFVNLSIYQLVNLLACKHVSFSACASWSLRACFNPFNPSTSINVQRERGIRLSAHLREKCFDVIPTYAMHGQMGHTSPQTSLLDVLLYFKLSRTAQQVTLPLI